MKKLLVVADWAHDSLTNQEVKSAVEGFLKEPEKANISFIASAPSTINTSYIISQLVEVEERYGRPLETVLFQNTDTRLQTKEGVEQAKGAEFIIIRLKSGMYLCGPNAGYDFSLIHHKIEEVYHYEGLDKGSQFRSRDLYARVSAHLVENMEDQMDLEEGHLNMIPELRGHYVGHIDNYGNIKTTIKREDIKGKVELNSPIKIKINNVIRTATYVSNLFGGEPGKLVLYPGSSGEKDNPYMEITIWRHFTEENPTTGAHEFNNARPGMEIELLS